MHLPTLDLILQTIVRLACLNARVPVPMYAEISLHINQLHQILPRIPPIPAATSPPILHVLRPLPGWISPKLTISGISRSLVANLMRVTPTNAWTIFSETSYVTDE